jgi:magnesium transporter
MSTRKFLNEIRDNIEEVARQDNPVSQSLWNTFLNIHPADIADFLSDLSTQEFRMLFNALPKNIKLAVFEELSEIQKVSALTFMGDQERIAVFQELSSDELTDLFDQLSDEELKLYLNLLNQKSREEVLSLMQFDPESAGGIMTTDIFTLMPDFTVEKSIKILQRLSPDKDIHQQIYIIARNHFLEGHINLQDLVLQKPHDLISSFMRKNELVVDAQEDREVVAKKMVHYGVMTVPVIDRDNHFLGVITSEALVDVIVEEATEDVQKMASLAPMKYPYFDSSLIRLFYERGPILIALLFAQSFSSNILQAYEGTLSTFLLCLVPMLTSTGGNTSNQTSALVIQGLASGEITPENAFRLIKREVIMSLFLAFFLGLTAFTRVYFTGEASLIICLSVSCSIVCIVITSVFLGSCIPLILRRINIDPAFSAGPFLATLMDILGVMIYCKVISLILG